MARSDPPRFAPTFLPSHLTLPSSSTSASLTPPLLLISPSLPHLLLLHAAMRPPRPPSIPHSLPPSLPNSSPSSLRPLAPSDLFIRSLKSLARDSIAFSLPSPSPSSSISILLQKCNAYILSRGIVLLQSSPH